MFGERRTDFVQRPAGFEKRWTQGLEVVMVWQQPGSAQAIVPGERQRVACLVKVAVE